MGRTACTEPRCLYSRAIPLLSLWNVRPVQSLSARPRVHFFYHLSPGEGVSLYPLGRRLNGPQSRREGLWRIEEYLALAGNQTVVTQSSPYPSHFNDWATPIHSCFFYLYTGGPPTRSNYTRCCINTLVLLKMITELLETCRGFK
jgi:hypothetical protein